MIKQCLDSPGREGRESWEAGWVREREGVRRKGRVVRCFAYRSWAARQLKQLLSDLA